jgi:antitoxin (DNA-binding transcriptional repressor) of toxin-antitoxin stability system
MERITAEEAGKRLFEILERDAHGERLIITHAGKDKAEIGPAEEAAIRRARQAADTIPELSKTIRLLGIPIMEIIEDCQA